MDRVNALLRRVPEWVVYVVALAPAPWLFYRALTGDLGIDPVKTLEHSYGLYGLQFLLATLAVTPLRRYAGLNLLRFRRALGLITFIYVALHLLVWLVLDVQIPSQIIGDILKRPYVTVGMVAFVLMIPLAVTSSNKMIRRLGARWRSLHRLIYLVVILAGLHFIWLRKGVQYEPLLYMGFGLLLLALRLKWSQITARFSKSA